MRRQSDRGFGLMFAAVFAAATALGYFVFGMLVWTTLVLSLAFLGLALAAPGLLMPLNRLWAALAMRLGAINNFLLLSAFFYLVVWPMGAVMRLVGRDAMERKIERSRPSYWREVRRQATGDTLSDMF